MKQQLLTVVVILLSILSVGLAPVFAQKEDTSPNKEDKPIQKEDKPTQKEDKPPKEDNKADQSISQDNKDKTGDNTNQANDNSGSNNVDQKTEDKKDIPNKDDKIPTVSVPQSAVDKKVKCDKDISKLDKKTNTCIKKKEEEDKKQPTTNNNDNVNPTTKIIYKNYVQNKISSNTKISSSSSVKEVINNNIFGATTTNDKATTTTITPSSLLLLDAKQLLDRTSSDNSGISAIQSLFCTTSLVSTYNQLGKIWNIAGNVQNINTVTPNAIPNIKANALFYDASGNSIGAVSNIALAQSSLAQNEESSFTFSASVDNDMNGQMPTFIVIFYTF